MKASSPQKIIIIGPAHPLRPGGITTFNERLCRAFLAAGYDCKIYSFSLQYPSFLFPGSSQFTDAPAPTDITIYPVINSINPLNWLQVGNRIRNEKPDLVVVRYWIPFMGPCLGTMLRRVRNNRHTKVMCLADNVIPHEKRPGDESFTRYFIKAVDAFTVMSRQVAKDLRTFTDKPVQLVPHPLYDNFGTPEDQQTARTALLEKFGINIKPNERLAVFFGLVRQYKGLDLLIEALSKTKHTDLKLLVAGEFYEAEDAYRQQIAALGLRDRIILHNRFIAENDVKHVICAADVIIQPYRSATQSGVSPVAYHFEVPMIVTNVGGLPEVVPHMQAGIVAEPSPTAISRAIDTYFDKGSAFFADGLKAEKQKLSWENMVKALINSAAS